MGSNDSCRPLTDVHAQANSSCYSEDGVDLTLIRWMLSLTPAERLDVLQNTVASILRLRGDQT
jgi:hypothetical protein